MRSIKVQMSGTFDFSNEIGSFLKRFSDSKLRLQHHIPLALQKLRRIQLNKVHWSLQQ